MRFRSFAADDIFISYTRLDASTYAAGLADELTKKGFSCFIDKLGTDPNHDLPDMLRRKIRSCEMLVVVGTERAGSRQTIEDEIQEFLRAGRRSSVVMVDFDGAIYRARWYKLLEGIAPEPEANPNALKDGNPSPSVVSRIEKQFVYRRRDERLRRITRRAIAVLVGLIITIIAAGGLAWYQLRRAAAETAKADAATIRANEETARAEKATQDAEDALARAKDAQKDAETARADAITQKGIADRATAEAVAKTKLANEATRKAQAAESRADKEQAIAEARSLANRAQTLLRQRPDEVPRSLKLAIDSMEKSSGAGLHALEADTALRDSLALLPRLRSSEVYSQMQDYTAVTVALSPDGRHLASIGSDSKLRVYESGGAALLKDQTPIKKLDCECSAVALSSGPSYAAAVLNEGGIKIFDLKDDARSHTVRLAEGNTPQQIALSPGGRFLALSFDEGEDVGRHSKLVVMEAASGKPVKSFDDLNLLIQSVAFGASGNLAVGGKDTAPQGERFIGKAVVWSLPRTESDQKTEPELMEDSFTDSVIIPQESEVTAVAPGGDSRYLATDKGVWKRRSGQTRYEPVAYLPYSRDFKSKSTIKGMAFGPDGTSLALVRYIQDATEDANGKDEDVLEVWDEVGQGDVAQVFHSKAVDHVGFKPDGQSVAATTGPPSKQEPIRVFQAAGGKEVDSLTFEPGPGDGQVMYVSPGEGYIVTVGSNVASVWDVWGKKKMTASFGDALKSVEVAALSPGGKFLALSGRGKERGEFIIVYRSDGGTYNEWKRIPQNGVPGAMSLSTDGQRLAVLYRYDINFVRVWDVGGDRDVTPESLLYLAELKSESFSSIPDMRLMSLSPGGRFLAVTDLKNRTQLLDLSKEKVVKQLTDIRAETLVFSPDDRYLGLGSDEGILYVFDTGRPEDEVARLQHTGTITAAAFSQDNRYVATASSDPHPYHLGEEESYPLRVWLLQPKDLMKEAAARIAGLHAAAR